MIFRQNIVSLFDKLVYHINNQIVRLNATLSYFNDMIRKQGCRVDHERYKVGEVWVADDLKWRICTPECQVEFYKQPFRLMDTCRGTLGNIMSTIYRLQGHDILKIA